MHRYASLFGRRGVLAAAVVAGSVLIVGAAKALVGAANSSFIGVAIGALPPQYLETIWGGAAWTLYGYYLPFTVGVFASLWLIAPVAAELGLWQVVARSVLATGIGAAVALIASAAPYLVGAFSGVGSLFGNSFPTLPFNGITRAALLGLQAGSGAFVELFPLVILAGIFLWLWLQKHPSGHETGAVKPAL